MNFWDSKNPLFGDEQEEKKKKKKEEQDNYGLATTVTGTVQISTNDGEEPSTSAYGLSKEPQTTPLTFQTLMGEELKAPETRKVAVKQAPLKPGTNPFQNVTNISQVFGTENPEEVVSGLEDLTRRMESNKKEAADPTNVWTRLYGQAFVNPDAILEQAGQLSAFQPIVEFARGTKQAREKQRQDQLQENRDRSTAVAQQSIKDKQIAELKKPIAPTPPPNVARVGMTPEYEAQMKKYESELAEYNEKVRQIQSSPADIMEGFEPGKQYYGSNGVEVNVVPYQREFKRGNTALSVTQFSVGRTATVDVTDLLDADSATFNRAVNSKWLSMLGANQEQIDRVLAISPGDFQWTGGGGKVLNARQYDEMVGLIQNGDRLFAKFSDASDTLKLTLDLVRHSKMTDNQIGEALSAIKRDLAGAKGNELVGGAYKGKETYSAYEDILEGREDNSFGAGTLEIGRNLGRTLVDAVNGSSQAAEIGWNLISKTNNKDLMDAYAAIHREDLRGVDSADNYIRNMDQNLLARYRGNPETIDIGLRELTTTFYAKGQSVRAASAFNINSLRDTVTENTSSFDPLINWLTGGNRVIEEAPDGTIKSYTVGQFQTLTSQVNQETGKLEWSSRESDTGASLATISPFGALGAAVGSYSTLDLVKDTQKLIDSKALPSYVTVGNAAVPFAAVVGAGVVSGGIGSALLGAGTLGAFAVSTAAVTGTQLLLTKGQVAWDTPENGNRAMMTVAALNLLSAGFARYAPKMGLTTRSAASGEVALEVLPELGEALADTSRFYEIKQVWDPVTKTYRDERSFSLDRFIQYVGLQVGLGAFDFGAEVKTMFTGRNIDSATIFPTIFGDGSRYGVYMKNPETGMFQFESLKPKEVQKLVKENEGRIHLQNTLKPEQFEMLKVGQSGAVSEFFAEAFGKDIYQGTQRSRLDWNNRNIFFNPVTNQVTTLDTVMEANSVNDRESLNKLFSSEGALAGAGLTIAEDAPIFSRDSANSILNLMDMTGGLNLNSFILTKSGKNSLNSLVDDGFVSKQEDGTYALTEAGRKEMSAQNAAKKDLFAKAEQFLTERKSESELKKNKESNEWHKRKDANLKKLGYTDSDISSMSEKDKSSLTEKGVAKKDRQAFEARQPKQESPFDRVLNEYTKKGGEYAAAAKKYLVATSRPVRITPADMARMSDAEREVVAQSLSFGLLDASKTGVVTNNEYALKLGNGAVVRFGVDGYDKMLTFRLGAAIESNDAKLAKSLAKELLRYRGESINDRSVQDTLNVAYSDFRSIIDQNKIAEAGPESEFKVLGPMESQIEESIRKYRDELKSEKAYPESAVEDKEGTTEQAPSEVASETVTEPKPETEAPAPAPRQARKPVVTSRTPVSEAPRNAFEWTPFNREADLPNQFAVKDAGKNSGFETYTRAEDGTWVNSRGEVLNEESLRNLLESTSKEVGVLTPQSTAGVTDQDVVNDTFSRVAEEFAGEEGARVMNTSLVTSDEMAENGNTLLQAKGTLNLGNGVKIEITDDLTDPWDGGLTNPSTVVSDDSGRSFMNQKLWNLVTLSFSPGFNYNDSGTVTQRESGWGFAVPNNLLKANGLNLLSIMTSQDSLLTPEEIALKNSLLSGPFSQYTDQDFDTFRDYLNSLEDDKFSLAVKINTESYADYTADTGLDPASKLDSTLRHETIHLILFNKYGDLGVQSVLNKLVDQLSTGNGAIHKLATKIASPYYRARFGNLETFEQKEHFLQEIIAHATDTVSLAEGLGLSVADYPLFAEAYYDIMTELQASDPDIYDTLARLADPEITSAYNEIYEARRKESAAQLGNIERGYEGGGGPSSTRSDTVAGRTVDGTTRAKFSADSSGARSDWNGSGRKYFPANRAVTGIPAALAGAGVTGRAFAIRKPDGTMPVGVSYDETAPKLGGEFRLADVISDENARSAYENMPFDQFQQWAWEHGYQGAFGIGDSPDRKYIGVLFDRKITPRTISPELEAKARSESESWGKLTEPLMSVSSEKDLNLVLPPSAVADNVKALDTGKGIYHFSRSESTNFDIDNRWYSNSAPAYIIDSKDPLAFYVNEKMLHSLMEFLEGTELPADYIESIGGFSVPSVEAFMSRVTNMLGGHMQANTPLFNKHRQHLDTILEFAEKATGLGLADIVAFLGTHDPNDPSNVLRPFVLSKHVLGMDAVETYLVNLHEGTHRNVTLVFGPNIVARLNQYPKTEDNPLYNPYVQKIATLMATRGNAHYKMEARDPHAMIQEMMAHWTNPDTLSEIGVDVGNTRQLKDYARATGAVIQFIAKNIDRPSAVSVANFVDPMISNEVKKIYGNQLPQLGRAREIGEATPLGPVFSVSGATADEQSGIIEAHKRSIELRKQFEESLKPRKTSVGNFMADLMNPMFSTSDSFSSSVRDKVLVPGELRYEFSNFMDDADRMASSPDFVSTAAIRLLDNRYGTGVLEDVLSNYYEEEAELKYGPVYNHIIKQAPELAAEFKKLYDNYVQYRVQKGLPPKTNLKATGEAISNVVSRGLTAPEYVKVQLANLSRDVSYMATRPLVAPATLVKFLDDKFGKGLIDSYKKIAPVETAALYGPAYNALVRQYPEVEAEFKKLYEGYRQYRQNYGSKAFLDSERAAGSEMPTKRINLKGQDGFYSNLRTFFEGHNPNTGDPHNVRFPDKAKGKQWMDILSDQPGVKMVEVEWTGLDGYLRDNTSNTLTLTDVTDWLDAHRVTTQVIVKEGVYESDYDEDEDDYSSPPDDMTRYSEYTLPGRVYEHYEAVVKIATLAKARTSGLNWLESDLPLHTRLESYVSATDGKTLYRVAGRKWLGDRYSEDYSVKRDTGYSDPQTAINRYMNAEILGFLDPPHFDDVVNPTVHGRGSERKTSDGEDSFHIDEIQSDLWKLLQDKSEHDSKIALKMYDARMKVHETIEQLGNISEELGLDFTKFEYVEFITKGLLGGAPKDVLSGARAFTEEDAMASGIFRPDWVRMFVGYDTDKGKLVYNFKQKLLADPARVFESARKARDLFTDNSRYDTMAKGLERMWQTNSAPEMPFTDNWVDVGMKAMIKIAADTGAKVLTWTTGEQQLKRYQSLMRQKVDKIEYEKFSHLDLNEKAKLEQELKEAERLWEDLNSKRAELDPSLGATPEEREAIDVERQKLLSQVWETKDKVTKLATELSEFDSRLNKVRITAYKNGQAVLSDFVPLEGEGTIQRQRVTLNGLVGSKMAKEIREAESMNGSFEGDNISLGAEGYDNVYNKQIKRFVERYFKKYGVKVGVREYVVEAEREISNQLHMDYADGDGVDGYGRYLDALRQGREVYVLPPNPNKNTKRKKVQITSEEEFRKYRQEAKDYYNKFADQGKYPGYDDRYYITAVVPEVKEKVWAVEIPSEFAANVREFGQPLFSVGRPLDNTAPKTQPDNSLQEQVTMSRIYGKKGSEITTTDMKTLIEKGNFTVISPQLTGMTPEEVDAKLRQLQDELSPYRMELVPVTGVYDGIEKSFVVTYREESARDMLEYIAFKLFNQESVLHGQGGKFSINFADGRLLTSSEVSFGTQSIPAPDQMGNLPMGTYASLPDGDFSFNVNFDWNKTRQEEPKDLSLMESKHKFGKELASKNIITVSKAGKLYQQGGWVGKDGVQLSQNDAVGRDGEKVGRWERDVELGVNILLFDNPEEHSYLWEPQETLEVVKDTNGNPVKKNGRVEYVKVTKPSPISTFYAMNADKATIKAIKAKYKDKLPVIDNYGGQATIGYQMIKEDGKGVYKYAYPYRFFRVGDDQAPVVRAGWDMEIQMQQLLQNMNQVTLQKPGPQPVPPTKLPAGSSAAAKALYQKELETYNKDLASWEASMQEWNIKRGELFKQHIINSIDEFRFEDRKDWNVNFYKNIPELARKFGKKRQEVALDLGKLNLYLVLATTSGAQGVKPNLEVALNAIQSMFVYYETGELYVPTVVHDENGMRLGEDAAQTARALEEKSLRMGGQRMEQLKMMGMGYLRVNSPEAQQLLAAAKQEGKRSGKKAVDVEAEMIVRPSEVLPADQTFRGQKGSAEYKFIYVPEFHEFIKERGSLRGIIEYATSYDPNTGSTKAQNLFGEKIGAFFGNMAGISTIPTIDRWMDLYAKLVTGTAYDLKFDGKRVTSIVDNTQDLRETPEAPNLPTDYGFTAGWIQSVTELYNNRYNTNYTESDVQSILWGQVMTTLGPLTETGRTNGGEDYLATFMELVTNDPNLIVEGGNPDYLGMAAESQERYGQVLPPQKVSDVNALTKGNYKGFGMFSVSNKESEFDARQKVINLTERALRDGDPEAWENIARRMVRHGALADSEVQAIKALAEKGDIEGLKKYTLGLNKMSPLELLVNVGRVSLLLGVKNIVKNVAGNSLRQFMDEVSRVPASVMDIGFVTLNKAMGGTNFDRSTTSLLTDPVTTLNAYKNALVKGGAQGGKEFIEVLRGKDQGIVYEHPSLFRERTTGWAFLRPLEIFEKYGWRFQGAMDRPFNAIAFHRTLAELQKMRQNMEAENGNEITFEEAENYLTIADYQMAEQYALHATFQKDNPIANKYYQLIDGLPPTFRAIITNITKFVKTPLNVVDYIMDYTGFWPIAKLAVKEYQTKDWVNWKGTVKKVLDNPQDRKVMSLAISQGLIGSLMLHIGYRLAEAGLLSGFFDREEKKEEEQMEAKGTSFGKVRIGNTSIDISWLAPNSFYLLAGATMFGSNKDYEEKMKQLRDDLALATEEQDEEKVNRLNMEIAKMEKNSPSEEYFSRIVKNLALQTPFLRQLDDIKTAYDQNQLVSGLLGRWVSPEAYVPAIVKEIGGTMDEYERVVDDTTALGKMRDRIQRNIPTLPVLSTIGQKLESTGVPFVSGLGKILSGREAMPIKYDMLGRPVQNPQSIDPLRTTAVTNDFLITELDKYGISITKPEGLTTTQMNELRKQKGEYFEPILRSMVETNSYTSLDDKNKKKVLEAAVRMVTNNMKKSPQDKLTDNDIQFNVNMLPMREAIKTTIRETPERVMKPVTITDKRVLLAFNGAGLPARITIDDILSDIKSNADLAQFVNDKFQYEIMVSDKTRRGEAEANLAEFQADPTSTIIRWWAQDKRFKASTDRTNQRREQLANEGKTTEEIEKIIKKEASRRGVDTRRKMKSFKQIEVTR